MRRTLVGSGELGNVSRNRNYNADFLPVRANLFVVELEDFGPAGRAISVPFWSLWASILEPKWSLWETRGDSGPAPGPRPEKEAIFVCS